MEIIVFGIVFVPVLQEKVDKIFLGVTIGTDYHNIIEGAIYNDLSIESFPSSLLIDEIVVSNPYIRQTSNYTFTIKNIGWEIRESTQYKYLVATFPNQEFITLGYD